MHTIEVIGAIALINAVVWGLFFWQRNRLMKRTLGDIERSGRTWVIPPESGFYQGMLRGIISAKTMGAMGLTDDEIIFIPPLGGNKVIPLNDVVGLESNKWFAGNYRNGREFLIIELRDGNKVGFQVNDHQRWMQEIKQRIQSVP